MQIKAKTKRLDNRILDYNVFFTSWFPVQMTLEVASLVPVIGTVAAALVAGGIARANLIASKETKVSEFRQAWIDALREDLAALFSNTRTLARSVQEFRAPQSDEKEKFGIDKIKITVVRHGAAENYHRICLRLNASQGDHRELLRLLNALMAEQQAFMSNKEGDVIRPIAALEEAASFAEGVLKAEWETVKLGERAYRDALRATKYTLVGSFAILASLVVGLPIYAYSSNGVSHARAVSSVSTTPPKAVPIRQPLPRSLAPAPAR